MSCFDKVRLGIDIQNPHAIPMMTSTRNQHLIRSVPCTRIVAVVAHVPPHVAPSIDQRESWGRQVEVAVLVVPRQIRAGRGWDGLW